MYSLLYQSIYRWRNGDWGILNNLKDKIGPFAIQEKTLKINRRSESRIIRFNNELFTAACDWLNSNYKDEQGEDCDELKQAYKDVAQETCKEEEKGYVKVSFLSKKEDISYEENMLEQLSNEVDIDALKDENTGFSQAVRKVRKLDKSIGDTLKKLYDYHCQLTGERIGDQYSAHVVEAHHIVPFTKSLNNDASNIIIINPTFHRIIHQTKPEYKNLSFIFPNGVVEKIKLNKHL